MSPGLVTGDTLTPGVTQPQLSFVSLAAALAFTSCPELPPYDGVSEHKSR